MMLIASIYCAFSKHMIAVSSYYTPEAVLNAFIFIFYSTQRGTDLQSQFPDKHTEGAGI